MNRSTTTYVNPCYFCGVYPLEDSDFPCVGTDVSCCGLCIENFQLTCINPICTSLINVEENNWNNIRKGELIACLCSVCDRAGFKKCNSCNTLSKRIAGRLPFHLSKITYPRTGYVTKVGKFYLCDKCIRYCDECKSPGLCEQCAHCDRLRCRVCANQTIHVCSDSKNIQARFRKRKSMVDPFIEQDGMSPDYCEDSPVYDPIS